MPVAETFTFTDDTGASLGDIARLDTLVTVVDGSSFLDELYAADELRGRGWEATETDERTVAQLFCDQLAFANVIVMNKMDLMDGPSKARLKAVLRRFNPEAQLIEATYSQVDPARVLGTRLFELSKAAQAPAIPSSASQGLGRGAGGEGAARRLPRFGGRKLHRWADESGDEDGVRHPRR